MKKGYDVRIDKLAVIKRPELVTLGNHVSIDCFVYISTAISTKNWIHIAPFTSIIGGVHGHLSMGEFTVLAAGARIICASDDWNTSMICSFLPEKYRNIISKPIEIGDFCGVGTNAVVMPGIKMAMGSIVGVNSLLMQDTVPWGIYMGTPARLVKMRDNKEILKSAKALGHEI